MNPNNLKRSTVRRTMDGHHQSAITALHLTAQGGLVAPVNEHPITARVPQYPQDWGEAPMSWTRH